MITIKASCPTCGEVDLPNNEITLRVCNNRQLLSYYLFICPVCHTEVRKPADDHVVSLLLSGGVKAELFDIPAEVFEVHHGPPISWDDLLDFHQQLESV